MLRLMIVDDSNIIRKKINRSQQYSNRFEIVASAFNGIDAVDKFRAHTPNVVTMDLTMPEMDGIACIQQLVAIDPEVMILVVSALADKATCIEALEFGANGFLCKPFTEGELVEALNELTEHIDV